MYVLEPLIHKIENTIEKKVIKCPEPNHELPELLQSFSDALQSIEFFLYKKSNNMYRKVYKSIMAQ